MPLSLNVSSFDFNSAPPTPEWRGTGEPLNHNQVPGVHFAMYFCVDMKGGGEF